MKPELAIERLRQLQHEATSLPQAIDVATFIAWPGRGRSVLTRALGPDHHLTRQFRAVSWPVPTWTLHNMREHMAAVLPGVRGILEAAVAELEDIAGGAALADEAGVDAELFEHITPEIQAEAWAKVASQAVIFTEDRIRKWAGRPVSEVGKDLAVAVFGDKGEFRMGLTAGEIQGWQLFAQGIAQALRNVDAHRIQDRPDHKRYALGLVGACSLLLTQMRYEHGNRFRDTSPAIPGGPPAVSE